jgi:hypothetical protein
VHTGSGGRLHGKGSYQPKVTWDLAVQPTLRTLTAANDSSA